MAAMCSPPLAQQQPRCGAAPLLRIDATTPTGAPATSSGAAPVSCGPCAVLAALCRGLGRGALGQLLGCLDQVLLSVLNLPQPLPEAAVAQARRLRWPAAGASVLAATGLGLQLLCLIKGWSLLLKGVPSSCAQLQGWLLGYCAVLTMMPFCFAFAGPLIIVWGLVGMMIRAQMPSHKSSKDCEHASPDTFKFVDTVLQCSLATCLLLFVAWILFWLLRRMAGALQQLWGVAGPTEREVVRRILAEPASEAEAGAECTICLDLAGPPSRGDQVARESGGAVEAGGRWRRLRCGHGFHERCLLEWLRRARRCPLCRMDLHAAYLTHSGGAVDGSEGEPSEVAV